MSLEVRDLDTLLNHATAVAQSQNPNLTDIGPGSVFYALLQAACSSQVWLEFVAVKVLEKVHLSTCTGSDVDSWLAPYGLTRLGASQATGVVTCSRYSATAPMLIPPGASFKTLDLSQVFVAVEDDTNAAWNASLGGYLCPAGQFSLDVPVQAVSATAKGNVQAQTITVVASSVAGLNACSNALPTVGGTDPESDDAFRARFPRFLATRGFATNDAVQRAVDSVQPGLFSTILENTNAQNATQLGFFTVYCNDGTPSPPGALLDSIRAAVNVVRPLTSQFVVLPAPVISATITATLAIANGYTPATVQKAVQTSLEAYVNGLDIGAPLSFYKLAALAADTAGVSELVSISLNGGTADLASAATSVIRTASVTVS